LRHLTAEDLSDASASNHLALGVSTGMERAESVIQNVG
jgi:hypothetical protein